MRVRELEHYLEIVSPSLTAIKKQDLQQTEPEHLNQTCPHRRCLAIKLTACDLKTMTSPPAPAPYFSSLE